MRGSAPLPAPLHSRLPPYSLAVAIPYVPLFRFAQKDVLRGSASQGLALRHCTDLFLLWMVIFLYEEGSDFTDN